MVKQLWPAQEDLEESLADQHGLTMVKRARVEDVEEALHCCNIIMSSEGEKLHKVAK